jgi:hypothetical protein
MGVAARITGLANGAARPGSHASLGADMSDDSTLLALAWGAERDGTQYGTGAAPTDYTASDYFRLYLTVTTATGTYRTSAPVMRRAPALTETLDAVAWAVGTTITPVDLSGAVTGEALVYGGAAYPGTALNRSTGQITGTPTIEGTLARVYTATNSGGSVSIPLGGAVTAVAPVLVGPVPDQTLTEDVAMTPLNLNDHVAGSNLVFSVTNGTLPAGVGITGGVIAGTPVTIRTAADVVFTVSNGGGSVLMTVRFAVAAAGVPPTITQIMNIDDSTDTWGVSSNQLGGELQWARLDAGGALPTADGAGGWNGTVLESGTVPYTSAPFEIDAGGTTDVSYKLAVYHRNNGLDSNVLATVYTADNTAPMITIQTLTPGNGTAGLVVSTDEGNGTLYWRVVPSWAIGPFPDNVKQGNSRTVTASGPQPLITLNGLTNGTEYRVTFLHRDAHRNDSDMLSQTFTPTTGASNIVTPTVEGFTVADVASVPDVTATEIANGFLIEDV